MSRGAGRLVAIEGVTGSGKSFISDALARTLTEAGLMVAQVGGFRPEKRKRETNEITRYLKRMMEVSRFIDLPWVTETLLLLVEQCYNVEAFVLDDLREGKVVLYENYDDALVAYQLSRWKRSGAQRQDVVEVLEALLELPHRYFGFPRPDLTIYVTASTNTIVGRLRNRDNKIVTADDKKLIDNVASLYSRLNREQSGRPLLTIKNDEDGNGLDRQLVAVTEKIQTLY